MLSPHLIWHRRTTGSLAMLSFVAIVACDSPRITQPELLGGTHEVALASTGAGAVSVVNVSNDTTAQNETPLAVNPRNPLNMLTGNNDWNWNDGCGFNVTFDGGKSWTKTLPDGFIPAITKYTNDPSIAGTGYYDYGGDPAVAFGPDGTAYFPCFGYQAVPPYGVVLLMNRSSDGGRTWLTDPTQVAVVSAFNGKGQAKGSTGQFPDHEQIHVANDGTIYVTWAQFSGYGGHSPVWVASSTDGGRTFGAPVKVTAGSIRSDQDARITSDPKTGVAYLTFDNALQGGKGGAMFVSTSSDRGVTWSTPAADRELREPGVRLSAILLQHQRQSVPRARLVSGAGVRPHPESAVRRVHGHHQRQSRGAVDIGERGQHVVMDDAAGGGARRRRSHERRDEHRAELGAHRPDGQRSQLEQQHAL